LKRPRRAPIEPPLDIKKLLDKCSAKKMNTVIDGIYIYPPSTKEKYWRLKYTFKSRSYEVSGGKDYKSVYAAFLHLVAIKESRHLASLGLPKGSKVLVGEALREYIEKGGSENKWKSRTKRDRQRDFGKLLKYVDSNKIRCIDLDLEDIRIFINSAGTIKRGKHLIGITKTFLIWGMKVGYFGNEQTNLPLRLQWEPPKGVKYTPAKSRRKQSQIQYANEGMSSGEVLSSHQVTLFSQELQKEYKYGEGLVNVMANLGTRASETFIFTASKDVANKRLGNYVDLKNRCVHINFQVNDDPGLNFKTTKNGKTRKVVIPLKKIVVNGFDVYGWLKTRSTEALNEHKMGKNELALIFPSDKGKIINLSNFSSRKVRVATSSLGWKMDPYLTANGQKRSLSRFTLHSLRAYFGTMAADSWLYQPNQLLHQGSWADSQTVRRFYQGTTDETFNSVVRVHSK
jgi:hypothetical protein